MYQKILVPLDGSKLAEGVLPHVKALAQANNSEVVLLRVAVNPAFEFAMSDPAIAGQIVASQESDAQNYMSEIENRLKAEGLKVSSQIYEGAVAETVLKVADSVGADLIAMSTHGRSGVARWLIGSVADKIVRGASMPVFLVRPAQTNGE